MIDSSSKETKNKTARQSKPEGVHRVLVFFEKNDGNSAATTLLATLPPAGAPAAGGQPASAKAPTNATDCISLCSYSRASCKSFSWCSGRSSGNSCCSSFNSDSCEINLTSAT
uniref:Oxidoreductase-like domain-containing protein n=1 Tax=Parascaris univalens TaxID=6257 RepID=A0A915A0J5_PARUN